MSRHQRSWESFVEKTLRFRDYEQLYYGVCFLSKQVRVEYSHGCFQGDQVIIGHDTAAPLDVFQFQRAFDQHIRIAIKEETRSRSGDAAAIGMEAVASLQLGSVGFQVVSTNFTSLWAVAGGKRYAAIVQRLPFGLLIVVVRHPHTLHNVAPIVEECCAGLR